MTTLSYTVPVAGSTLNAIADPQVSTALNTILTWANGNVDTTNLSATAAILRSQLAGGSGNLIYQAISTNTSATDGHVYQVTAAGVTVTLPSPSTNATIGVFNGSGTAASPTTVTASSGNIVGSGVSASSISLGISGAHVMLQANGSNWLIVAGQQDTGWVACTLGTNITVPGGYAPAVFSPTARIIGDMGYLSGVMMNNTGGVVGAGYVWLTLPSSAFQPPNSVLPFSNAFFLQLTGTALKGVNNMANTTQFAIDGFSYRLS